MENEDFEKLLEQQDPETLEKIDFQNEIFRLKTKVLKLTSTNKDLHKQKIADDRRLGTVLDLKTTTKISKIIPTKSEVNEAVAVANLGDIHVEEEVDPNTVNGLNKYNLEICEERCHHYARNVMKAINSVRKQNNITKLVVNSIGDWITGHIHEEFIENNFLSPTEASLFAKNIFASILLYFYEHGDFEKIEVNCLFGNHGRTTKYKPIATKAKQSYEWLIYKILEDEFRNVRKMDMKFNIAGGALLYHDIYGYKIRVTHGDALRFGGGVGGVTVPLNKKIAKWDESIKADITILGHYHQFLDLGNALMNPSVIGYNAYAVEIGAKYEKPFQTLFLVDSKRKTKGITCPIWLD